MPESALSVAQQTQQELTQAIELALEPYRNQYIFDTPRGTFAERVINHLNSRPYSIQNWLDLKLKYGNWEMLLIRSIGVVLFGCSGLNERESIPCRVRIQIENDIINAFGMREKP